MVEVIRTAATRGVLVLTCVTLLVGCGRRVVNGYYVSRGSADQVVMAQIVEAPRGHLSGAIVVTTVDVTGTTPTVSSHGVHGSISSQNVSLSTTGWFGLGTILVGSLADDRLTLSVGGNQAFTLDRMSESHYQRRIQALQRLQSNIVATRAAAQGLQEATAYAKQLVAALQQYQTWGRQRTANQSAVRTWWDGKIKYYTTCLATISPLAAAGVPKWKWQACAINVMNDVYYRNQMLSRVHQLEHEAATKSANLRHGVSTEPAKAQAAAQALHRVCPRAQNPKACDVLWQRWTAQEPAMVLTADVVAFNALVPQVDQAVNNDVDVAKTDDAKLDGIAAKIGKIYWAR